MIEKHVEDGSRVYTDALHSYDNLRLYYQHQVINHAESYAKGQVHTKGMENFWSLLKRSIRGTYVSVEPFHLFRYLDEQAFRFNEHEGNDADRFVRTMRQIQGRRLTFRPTDRSPPRPVGESKLSGTRAKARPSWVDPRRSPSIRKGRKRPRTSSGRCGRSFGPAGLGPNSR